MQMIKSDLQNVPTMDKFAKHLKHYERQRRLLKAHETKSALITKRKEILESQNRVNYKSEYNRMVGALSVNGHRAETIGSRNRKRERMVELSESGATATNMNKII